MKRRNFIKKSTLAAAGAFLAPYILPTGRLFAATGSRLANHVIFFLYAGGIRNQESVDQEYLANQSLPTQGNVMPNMLEGAQPTANLVYNQWTPAVSTPLTKQGTLFREIRYMQGPTGHYNAHAVAVTGNYITTGLNEYENPSLPTVFEYYRKHTDPAKSAINAWWVSEGLGPYPSLNYSSDPGYGSSFGANHFRPASVFGPYSDLGNKYLANAKQYQPDDANRIATVKTFLDSNFDKTTSDLPGIANSDSDKELIKQFMLDTISKTNQNQIDWPLPNGVPMGQLSGDLINIAYAWEILQTFAPELMILNTTNVDVCHNDFSSYITNLHKSDYGVGWLWNKIQNDPTLKNDTILICMPEHGRNLDFNSIVDNNGFRAYDHTSDDNSRRGFALIVGPPGVVKQDKTVGTQLSPVGEHIDIIPTIAHILDFKKDIPAGLLGSDGSAIINQAF